jgi:ribosomal protein L11 methyltransferase
VKKRSRSTTTEKWWTAGIASVNVGHNLRITPYWESWKSRADRHNLIVDPGASFGSGNHPTTIIALELLEKTIAHLKGTQGAFSLLDVGTGTGVLTIAAEVLGCNLAVGCDVDPSAIYLARRNVGLNQQTHSDFSQNEVCFYVGPIEAVRGKFDIVIANLAAPVLLRLKEELVAHTGSCLILSGIPDSMFDLVKNKFALRGTKCREAASLSDWNGLIFETS